MSRSPTESYRVTLAEPASSAAGGPAAQSPLLWTDVEHGQVRTYSVDPGAGFVRNALTGLFRMLPVDGQL